MINAGVVGHAQPVRQVVAIPARLRRFADAIGETRAFYRDTAAARAAGYPDIPLPPTYLFSLILDQPQPFAFLRSHGADLTKLLHAEQTFVYDRLAFAGEPIRLSRTVADLFERRGGALQFVAIDTAFVDAAGKRIACSRETLVLPRDPVPPGKGGGDHAKDAKAESATLRCGPVTRDLLARYAEAAFDLNPVHLEPAVARKAGYEDVFAQGMLSMAWLGRLITDWTAPERLRSFSVRFHALTPLAARPTCEGRMQDDGRTLVLQARLQDGTVTLSGQATFG
jgi:acyl dehydratase